MSLNAINSPLRTVAMGCRISPCTLSALTFAASPPTYAAQFASNQSGCQRSRLHISYPQRRAITSDHCGSYRAKSTSLQPSIPSILSQVNSLRHASSSATTNTSSSQSSSSASDTSQAVNSAQLDWNSFFTLRASRRKYSLVSSILASLTTTASGAQFIASQNFENLGAQIMGFDPFFVLGLATIACGAAGWLAGPVLGNAVWGLVYRKYKGAVVIKEKEFYDRIKRFRVDPSANSFANPVPDYYGEKIGSVQGYRQWLKDQRAYNRKKRNFV